MADKNRFAGAIIDDSDDEVVQHKTKTAIKKEERKVTEKLPKINTTKMAEGGFEVVDKTGGAPKQEGQRGGRGGRGGEGRGGRGAARGGEGRADFRSVRKDADGNPIEPANKREKRPFTGKPREEGHPMDR